MLGHTIESEFRESSDFRRHPRKKSLSLTVALMNFALLAWLAPARAQTSSSASPTPKPESTVSFRELQVPAKARDALVRGVERLRRGDTTGSLSQFNRAIQQAPDYPEAYFHKGLAEIRLNRINEAIESFQKAIDLSGGHYTLAYVGYGQALAKLGKLVEAEAVLRRSMEETPTLPEGYVALSLVLLEEHRLNEAEATAQKALQLPDPLAWKALLSLACVHLERGEYPAAVQQFEAYLRHLRSLGDNGLALPIEQALNDLKANVARLDSAR
jgi:tetratricopeptide (TPR) repeat protein